MRQSCGFVRELSGPACFGDQRTHRTMSWCHVLAAVAVVAQKPTSKRIDPIYWGLGLQDKNNHQHEPPPASLGKYEG